jgi:TPR repeat protein
MKPAEYSRRACRHFLLSALLFAGLSAPLAANEMWEALFKDQLENARSGDAEAQYEVGIMYLKGQGVEQDRDKAVEWLKSAAASGNEQADSKLARIEEQESKFNELKGQAKRGDLEAQYELAMMYLKGRGVEADGKTALRYLQDGADKGDEKSITRLGIVSFKGEVGRPDYKKALQLFNRVSAKSVLAQYYLGEMYASGSGVKRNYDTAIDWYKKAADGGFNRASGKIINLEEEIKTEQRRKANRARLAQQQKVAAAAARAAAAKKAAAARKPAPKAAKAAPEPTRKVARRAAPKPPVRKQALNSLDSLVDSQWLRNTRPVDYLPSRVTRCDRDEQNLVCFSEVLQRKTGTNVVEYRVKSIITNTGESYDIVYRNLVLDVTDARDHDDQPLGYDDQMEKGFHVKTGWTPEHRVVCKHAKDRSLSCDKDSTHQITLVAED